MTRLRIVIVNWNAGQLLHECLVSIAGVERASFEIERVVVVDNASVDASLDGLSDLELPLVIIRNPNNRGFAAACNQGAQGFTGEYLLFLNPDTRLFAASLTAPLAFMQAPENAGVGICGIQLIGDSGKPARSCARFPTAGSFIAQSLGLEKLFPRHFRSHFMSEWDHTTTRSVDQVIGAFYLVRAGLFRLLGGFDERFFVYLEDLDFSLRAARMGWSIWYLAEARAWHKGGGTSARVKARRLFYSLQSRLLFAFKHFPRWQAFAVLVVTAFAEPWPRMVYCFLRGGGLRCSGETVAGFAMLYRVLPGVLRVALRP